MYEIQYYLNLNHGFIWREYERSNFDILSVPFILLNNSNIYFLNAIGCCNNVQVINNRANRFEFGNEYTFK